MVDAGVAAEFRDAWRREYGREFAAAAASADFFLSPPGPGAMRV
jgi:hypothetical protein